MQYSINFQALALWVGVIAVVGGGYFFVSSDSSQQSSFSIGMEEDTVPGELTRLSVETDGAPVDGANISIDGEFIGTTNSQGIKGFETPENNFTVEASKGDISKETTFTVEDGSFSSPNDSGGSDSGEDSGDASDSLNNQDDSEGNTDGSDTGDQSDNGQDDQDQQQDDTTEEIGNDFTGLQLDEDPLVGELRTLTVYEDGEKVSSVEVTVNGEVIGSTNAGGTITFGVPDSAEISISTGTGISETFTVEDYTPDEQNQTGDQNDTDEDLTTGIQLDSDPVSGTTNRIILYDEGERVEDATVYLDEEELGQTGSNGAIQFSVPLKEQITVTTDYGLESQTFNVTEDHPEPDIILTNPIDGGIFETPQGQKTDVEFEASVEITEDSGTASVMIDASEAYSQELSQGENTISATEALSGGTHSWSVEVDTPEHKVSSSNRSLTVNEVEVEDGLSLQDNATAGEYNYVRLYDSGEPVEGTEITVNGDSIGTTDSNGEIGFEVPNVQEITVSASGYDSITQNVEGYTEEIDMAFSFSDTVYQGRSNTLTVTDQGSGDALNDATVYANGVEQGQTDSSGQITFTVPEENSVTVKAVKDNSDDNESFTAEVPPVDITWFGPEDGASINDYQTEFDFSLDLQESATATLDVEGQQQLQQDLSSGSHSITEQVKFENSGTRDYTLTVDSSSETRTETGSFTTEQDMPPIEINIDNPTDGETIDDYKTNIEYGFDSPEDFNYTIDVDGRELESLELLEGQGNSQSVTARCLKEGVHTLEIEADGLETGAKNSKAVNFETSSSMPIVDFAGVSPSDGETLSSPLYVQYSVRACKAIDFQAEIREGESTITNVEDTSLSQYETIFPPNQNSYSLDSDKYSLILSADSGASSKILNNSFTVE